MDRVDVHVVLADAIDAVRERVLPLLTEEEAGRHAAFRFDRNKVEYLLTRAIERGVLARALGARPDALRFARTALGKPELVAPSVGEPRFSLTNTIELVAIAVARGRDIGIDAEPVARADSVLEVADTVFTPYERAELDRLPAAERGERAVMLWTAKEAYIKARGMGFSLPVERFEMCFDDARAPRLRLLGIDDDPARWCFGTHRVAGHWLATCTEVSSSPFEVRVASLAPTELARLLG